MKRSFIVTLDVHDTSANDLAAYIRDAVGSWGGQYHPDSPLFSANWANDEVTVKAYKRRNKHDY